MNYLPLSGKVLCLVPKYYHCVWMDIHNTLMQM